MTGLDVFLICFFGVGLVTTCLFYRWLKPQLKALFNSFRHLDYHD
jgi:hypothetical protein